MSSTTGPLPLWLDPAHARHIVRGNLMTLSSRLKTVEQGEWMAHQAVEHFRILWNFVRVVHEKELDGTSICSAESCPKMSAGPNYSFTWLNKDRQTIELPAREYMTLTQRWISGKIDDEAVFPTDPSGAPSASHSEHSQAPTALRLVAFGDDGDDWPGIRSGFPKPFATTCRIIFRQIFRVYAHLYWHHFVDPFWHLGLEKELNSCFGHLVLTATALDLLRPDNLEPVQHLVDLWAADGTFPPESRAYAYASSSRARRVF